MLISGWRDIFYANTYLCQRRGRRTHSWWRCYHLRAVRGCPWFLWPRRSLWRRVRGLRRWKAERRGCWKPPGSGRKHPAGGNEGGSDSEEVEKAHTPESSGMPDWLRALTKTAKVQMSTAFLMQGILYSLDKLLKESLTCVTGARLRGVTSIKWRRSFFTAVRRRRRKGRLAVLVCPLYSPPSFRNISILEVFLQPGRNDALYCVCHSTDEAWLLLIKTCERERKPWIGEMKWVRGRDEST